MTQLVHTHVVGCFEDRATPLDNPANTTDSVWEDEVLADRPIRVTPDSAMTFAPWFQGLNVIANGVAQSPLKVYQKREPEGRREASEHPTYRVLHRRPNAEMGPFTFKHQMQFWCAAHGNAYAVIERIGAEVDSLWPVHPDRVTPFRINGELSYHVVGENGARENYFASEILHLRGPSDDGIQGKSVVGLAKDSLAVGMQAQRYGGQFFRNDAKPGVVLEFPNPVDEPTAKNILRHWERRHGGAHNAARPALLDRGGKVSPFSMSNEDAQFLETRQFSKAEVAGWLNLPPHMVGDLSRATFSNIEQQSIDYVVNSLMPWLIRWQDECNEKLFKPSEIESGSHYAEFILESRLRGDFLSQMQGFQIGLTCGIYNQDEVRERLNLNRLPSGLGQTFYYSQNMTPVGTVRDEPAKEPKEPIEETDIARSILSTFLLNELSRAYQRIGKSAWRASADSGRLELWKRDTLPKECRGLSNSLSQLADHPASQYFIGDPANIVRDVRRDFELMIENELSLDNDRTLKERVGGQSRRLNEDRPVQVLHNLLGT